MKSRESAKGRIRLRELGEDQLIAQLVAQLGSRPEVIAGPGDDCAVVAGSRKGDLLLFKTDCVVEGVHFRPNEKPAAIGWKAMMRALSDFAAMSGLPRYALITLVSPADREARWMKQLYQSLERAAARFDVAIVGGETSSTRGPLIVSISAAGVVEKKRCVLRSGGKTGGVLFVTGTLGGAGKRRHLHFVPRIEEARWLTRHFRLQAMMDLSDGLGADLPRLAKASGLDFEINEGDLPRNRGCTAAQAISDGEDYELLFALSPNDSCLLQKKWKSRFPRLSLTRIGLLIPISDFRPPTSFHGYLHFQ